MLHPDVHQGINLRNQGEPLLTRGDVVGANGAGRMPAGYGNLSGGAASGYGVAPRRIAPGLVKVIPRSARDDYGEVKRDGAVRGNHKRPSPGQYLPINCRIGGCYASGRVGD